MTSGGPAAPGAFAVRSFVPRNRPRAPLAAPSRITRRGRAAARASAFAGHVAATLAAYEVHERLIPEGDTDALLERYRRRFCRDALRLFAVRWSMNAPAPHPPGRARLVVSNHRSVVDIALLVSVFGGYVLSRADVQRWPLLGALARRAKTIFVERGDRRSGASAIRLIRRRLQQNATVIVFPEGGTHRGDEVRAFRAGVFAAARGLAVDVVPVGLAYGPGTEYVDMSFLHHLAAVAERSSTHVAGCIGAPIRIGGPGGASPPTAELAEQARDRVQTLVQRARQQLG